MEPQTEISKVAEGLFEIGPNPYAVGVEKDYPALGVNGLEIKGQTKMLNQV